MGDGAFKEYKFGQKNNWRRAIWNEVLTRTCNAHKVSPVLYLAGPEDLDRPIALAKGVPQQNLIAIDKSRHNIHRVKSLGVPAIQADAVDVMRAWPRDRPIAAVLMDFCHGLEQQAFRMMDALQRKPFQTAIVMANFQRGRDQSTGDLRRVAATSADYITRRCPPKLGGDLAVSEKNRAAIFYCTQCIGIADKVSGTIFGDERDIPRACDAITEVQKPSFFSYRSGPLVFDSVVFENVNWLSWPGWDHVDVDAMLGKDKKVAARVSAMIAVRTRRMKC